MWQAIAASQQGTSHVKTGAPCQDSHGYRILSDDTFIAAVADGLGTAAHSEAGSACVVNTALDVLSRLLDSDPAPEEEDLVCAMQQTFREARASLEAKAEELEVPLREVATTLIALAIIRDWMLVGQIGDGAAVAFFHETTLETVSKPERGEYANEVMPLTADGALEYVRIAIRQAPVKAVALLTDGLQQLCIQGQSGAPHRSFFMPFFESMTRSIDTKEATMGLQEFLKSDRVRAKTDDDTTLVVIGKVVPLTA